MRKYTKGFMFFMSVILLLSACEGKEKMTTTNVAQVNKTTKIFFTGSVKGTSDVTPFSEEFTKKRTGVSLERSDVKYSLNIHSSIAIMNIRDYNGVGNYDDKNLNFIKVKMNMKTMRAETLSITEKKIEILKDTEGKLEGTFSFTATSKSGVIHKIKGKFDFTKVLFDAGDEITLLKMIKLNSLYRYSVSLKLRGDEVFMKKAILVRSNCFGIVDESLFNDKAFILGIVKENPNVLIQMRVTNHPLSEKKSFMLEAVKTNKKAIMFLPPKFKKDKDIIEASKH